MSSQMWRVTYSASEVRALFLKLSLAGSTDLPTVSQPWRPETRYTASYCLEFRLPDRTVKLAMIGMTFIAWRGI